MFRYIENNKIIVKIILSILAITFITFGISTFSSTINDNNYILKLKDETITEYEIKNILNSQNKDYSKENIEETFKLLLNKVYLLLGSKKMNITIAPSAIKRYIYSIDMFKNNDVFDENLLNNFLVNSKISENQFINSIKKELYIKNLIDIFNNELIVSDNQINTFTNSLFLKKQIQQLSIVNKLFFNQIKPSLNELNNFYENNLQDYIQNESVKFEYIKIAPETIINTIKADNNEIKQYFEKVKNTAPQRMIYDILIAFPDNVKQNPVIRKELMKKAQALHKEIISNPENFEFLAQKYSDDKSSSINGGKLGIISKNGSLEKNIEDVAFNLKIGEISNIIENNNGFHIIKTTFEINGKDINKEKENIAYLIKRNKAYKKINEIKSIASDIAFDNPKELNSAAKAIGVKINKVNNWITKNNAKEYNIPQKVIDNLFTQDIFEQKNNSDLIDINNNESWIIRVFDTKEQQKIPFNEIKDQVVNDYKNYKAKSLAKLEAQKILLALQTQNNQKQDKLNLPWSKPENIDYQMAKYIFNDEQLNKFIKASPNNDNPNFFLVEKPEGFIIIKINKVIYPDNINIIPQDYKNLVQQNLFALQLNSFLQKQKSKFKTKQGKQNFVEIK